MYDIIICTKTVAEQLKKHFEKEVRTTNMNAPLEGTLTEIFGMKLFEVEDKLFDNVMTKEGKLCGAILIKEKDFKLKFPAFPYQEIHKPNHINELADSEPEKKR